jgi:TolB-like protein/DNA-binding winged helix-turn-helix (wHTH) protein/thioredoxin-like negative regulator of GroEL
MDALAKGFELDGLRVTPESGEISGPGGIVHLDPKVMNVLLLMAAHPGEVMTRESLVSRLWGQAVVTDDALTRCFYELRRQLVQAGGNERYRALIETLPKRGYRLNGSVNPGVPKGLEPTPTASAPATRTRPFRSAALAAVLAVVAVAGIGAYLLLRGRPEAPGQAAPVKGVVVLPFLDMSAEKDQGYFADGITEEILNRLSQSRNLKVTARTSAFALRDLPLSVPEIAERLDVDYVLEGSVRKSDQQLRITVQLVDAATDLHVWSKTYDGTLDRLFDFQDQIAASVATALHATLAGTDLRPQAPANVEAYEQYLMGQFFYNRRMTGDIEKSIGNFRKAVELDPSYARAWAALAGAYSLAIGELHRNRNPGMRALQGEAARRAVELDPRLAVAQSRLGQYYRHVGEHQKGDRHLRLAAALDPDDLLVLGFTANAALWRGDTKAAVDLWRRAVAQDPLSHTSRNNLAFMLYADGQFEEAIAQYRDAVEFNPAAGPQIEADIARAYLLLGRHDEARQSIGRLPEGRLKDSTLALMCRTPEAADEATAAVGRLEKPSGTPDPDGVNSTVRLAEAYAYCGREDDALDLLVAFQRRLEADEDRPLRDQWHLQNEMRLSPLLRNLHADARWKELTAPLAQDAPDSDGQ